MSKIRVLHYVNRWRQQGGIQKYVRDVLHHIDHDRFTLDLMVPTHLSNFEGLEAALKAYGSTLLPIPHRSREPGFVRDFEQIVQAREHYDIVHAHNGHMGGPVLREAHRHGIGIRVSHAHNDLSIEYANANFVRRIYHGVMKRWVKRHATAGIAVSRAAAEAAFGNKWELDKRWRIIYCGIDIDPFRESFDRDAARAELNIPADAFVVGHVGRFHVQKNHTFLVDIAAEIARQEQNAYFLLLGGGDLQPTIEQKVTQLGLMDRFRFAGLRPDVPRLMKTVMDCFILPSKYEGLPLTLLEAQAAGLPCIYADVITDEAEVVKPMVRRVSGSAPVAEWAQAILATRRDQQPVSRVDCLQQMDRSPFNMIAAVKALETFYEQAMQEARIKSA
jgi:glycosyltransferase involved in cell wall biosynthesis